MGDPATYLEDRPRSATVATRLRADDRAKVERAAARLDATLSAFVAWAATSRAEEVLAEAEDSPEGEGEAPEEPNAEDEAAAS